ncbi:MAG TPA: glycosyltransferase family 87 protein [Chloroflexota bacterium]
MIGNGGALLLGLVAAYLGLQLIGVTGTVALELRTVDLMEYYSAAQLILHGHAGLVYDWVGLGRLQYHLVAPYGPAYGVVAYLYPPYFVLALAPLFALPYSPVYIIWLGFNCLLLVATLYPLERYAGVTGRWRLVFRFGALTFLPVFLTLGLGQASIILLALFTACFFAARSEQHALAGVLLGVACIKPPYVLPFLLVFLLWKRWQTLLAFAITGGFLALAPVLVFGTSIYSRYLTMLFQTSSWQGRSMDTPLYFHHYYIPTGTYAAQWNHSFAGLTDLLLHGTAATAAGMALRLAVLAVLVWGTRRANNVDVPFALATIAALLIAPHVLAYDLSLLLIPVAVALRLRAVGRGSLACVLVAGYFGVAIGYRLVFTVPVQLSVVLMLALFGWLVLALHVTSTERGDAGRHSTIGSAATDSPQLVLDA